MDAQTAQRLLEVNREFYRTVAEPFNQTRYAESPGKQQLLHLLAPQLAHPAASHTRARVLDVGCGNGRLAWLLDRLGWPVDYTGVDGEPELLRLAAENTRGLTHVRPRWLAADLGQTDWSAVLMEIATVGAAPPEYDMPESDMPEFDVVVCLATLQHMPGYALRARVVRDLAQFVRPEGRLAISAWQFLSSARLAARQLPWSTIGLEVAQVEPGDALLPWKQEHYAVRYVHQIDPAEMAQLAADAGLELVAGFHADGREGNLNFYGIMART